MRPPLRLTALTLVSALAIALALAVSLGGSDHASQPPAPSAFDGPLLPPTTPPGDFTLTTPEHHRVSLHAYRGQVTILTFLSTASPRTSRLIAQQIRGALDALPTPIPVLAVTTNPKADTPAHIRAFLRRVSLTTRLQYLTGTPTQLREVWHAYDITPPHPGHTAPDRSAYVLLIDPRGVQRVRFYIEQLTPESLAHDIRKLQAD